MGILIVGGSDNLGGNSPNLHSELHLFAKCGLSPLETIIAATRNSARKLGIGRDYGTLEIDKVADLVILNANSAEDIRNTQTIEYMIQGGKLYKLEQPLRPAACRAAIGLRKYQEINAQLCWFKEELYEIYFYNNRRYGRRRVFVGNQCVGSSGVGHRR